MPTAAPTISVTGPTSRLTSARTLRNGRTTQGSSGFVAHFDPHERREVRAKSDARLLLILAPWPGEGRDLDFDA